MCRRHFELVVCQFLDGLKQYLRQSPIAGHFVAIYFKHRAFDDVALIIFSKKLQVLERSDSSNLYQNLYLFVNSIMLSQTLFSSSTFPYTDAQKH